MDGQFPEVLSGWGWSAEEALAAASDSSLPAHDCARKAANLACKTLFPACEIGVEVKGICRSACERVEASCKEAGVEMREGLCEGEEYSCELS